jgi:hypothetical protein
MIFVFSSHPRQTAVTRFGARDAARDSSRGNSVQELLGNSSCVTTSLEAFDSYGNS